MATTIKSVKGRKTWTMHDEPHEFFDSEAGWEGLRMTMHDAFEVYEEFFWATERMDEIEGIEAYRAACEVRDRAEANYQVAWRAVDADIYALARAMQREGWGTYLRAIERVESYYRECYKLRFGTAI